MSETLRENAQKRGISKAILWFYGVGDFGSSTFSNLKQYYWTFFLTTICMFPLGTIAILTTCTQILSIIMSPVYGAVLNGSKAMKWGRYRSWLLLPIPFCVIASVLAFTVIEGPWAPVWCGFFGILGTVFFDMAYNANLSLIGVIAKTPNDQAAMAASRGVYANIAVVAWSVIGSPFILLLGRLLGSDAKSYSVAALIYGVLYFVCYLVHFIISKPYEGVEEEIAATIEANAKEKELEKLAKKDDRSRLSLKDMGKSFIQNPFLMALAAPDCARWLMLFTMSATTVFYFTFVFDSPALMATYLLVANIGAIVGSLLMKYLVKGIGMKWTAAVGFLGCSIPLLIGRLCFLDITVVMICLCISKLAFGVVYTVCPALYAQAAVYSEWKTGKKATGWIMGLSNVPLQIATLFINLIITGFLAIGHYSPDIVPAAATIELKTAIANMFMGVEGALLTVCTIIFIFGYKLTTSKMNQVRSELEARKKT